jgi:hypothetical protein
MYRFVAWASTTGVLSESRRVRPLSLVCVPSELSALGLRELAHDEVVGILDHVLDHAIRYGPVDDHGVPMPLVQVIPREHGAVRRAELLREQRFTFQADSKRTVSEPGKREDLAGDLEHGRLLTKRKRLL